jgi:hypothetical protein
MTEKRSEVARSRAAKELFSYLCILRNGREPYAWETALAEALLAGSLVVNQPPSNPAIRMVHALVDGVELALSLPELAAEAGKE